MFTTLTEFLQTQLQTITTSEFLPGMFGAGLGTWVVYNVKSIPLYLKSLFIKWFSVTLEVRNTDESFYWVELYLAQQKPLFQRNYMVSFESERNRQFFGDYLDSDGADRTDYKLSQGMGSQWFWYEGRLVESTREMFEHGAEGKSDKIKEKIIIRSYFSRKKFLEKLVETARGSVAIEDNRMKIFQPGSSGFYDPWSETRKIRKRDIKSVILKEGQLEYLISDIETFLEEREDYFEKGIPYRRTYLLHGPPGTGKTTLAQAIAAHFNKNLAVVNMNTFPSDDSMSNIMGSTPKDSFVVIEDIDDFGCTRRNEGSNSKEDKISFSAFLNVLDGIHSPEERILFITTNHPERLDPAILRAGRVDVKLELGYCDYEQIRNQFIHYYDVEFPISKKEFNELNIDITPAYIQELYMCNRKSPNGFIKDFINTPKHV